MTPPRSTSGPRSPSGARAAGRAAAPASPARAVASPTGRTATKRPAGAGEPTVKRPPPATAAAKRSAPLRQAAATSTGATRTATTRTKRGTGASTAAKTTRARAATTAKTTRTRSTATATSPAAPAGTPAHPATLAIDIGGTGLKASVLDATGRLLADRVRVPTTYPCPPELMVSTLAKLVQPLPKADRASAGFPGVVRRGHVLTAPHFITKAGPGSPVVKELAVKWKNFDLAGELSKSLGIPVRIANDADLQGWAVVSGKGLEMVVTLGTGVGTALFIEGKLAPHLELAHHPFRKGETYNDQLGESALKRIGPGKWRKRVLEAIANFQSLTNYDHLYLGGGNARLMSKHVDSSITIVDNLAGILGGIKLWEHGGH
jgi:polyphosphate glucokinase